MTNQRYTARAVQNYGKKGWAIEFRHPMKFEAGRPGRKVRKGLDTSDSTIARSLEKELNELLGEESFHAISAMQRARQRFSAKVVEIFYGDLRANFVVFQGTRFVGIHRPLMVVTANTAIPGRNPPLSEHFVFYIPTRGGTVNCEVCRSTFYSFDGGDAADLIIDFPNIFTIESMVQTEYQMGRDHFENYVFETDRKLHKDLFWPDRPAEPFDFERLDDAPLLMMIYTSPYADKLRWMVGASENKSLRELGQKLAQMSKFKIQQKPIH